MKLKKEIKIDETNIDLETVVNNCVYSSGERIVGTRNGKPVYMQKFFINNINYTNGANNALGTIPNISEMIFLGGALKINNTGFSMLPYTSYSGHNVNANYAQNLYLTFQENNATLSLTVQHGSAVTPSSASYTKCHVIAIYQKTTD